MKRTLFINLTIYSLAIAGLILLVLPVNWFPTFYDVRYMGLAGILNAAFIGLLPLCLLVSKNMPEAQKKNDAAQSFQFLLAVIFLGNALGDLGLYQLYKVGFQYDRLLHLFVPALMVIIITIVLRDRFNVRQSYAISSAFAIILACVLGWEIFEFLSDHVANTHISGVYGLDMSNDTKWDIVLDELGSASGILALIFIPNPVRKMVAKLSVQR